MNATRNLNGVKRPLSDKTLGFLVSRVEERFAAAIFVPTAPVLEVVVSIHGTDECRCDVCVNKMLDGILERSEASLVTLTENLNA